MNAELFAQIKAKKLAGQEEGSIRSKAATTSNVAITTTGAAEVSSSEGSSNPTVVVSSSLADSPAYNTSAEFQNDVPFRYDEKEQVVQFAAHLDSTSTNNARWSVPEIVQQQHRDGAVPMIRVPLAPCVYRMTDTTYAKRQPIAVSKCVAKLGVLRCLQRECRNLNTWLMEKLQPPRPPQTPDLDHTKSTEVTVIDRSVEEDELGKTRFMELLSNCGIFQKVSELILKQAAQQRQPHGIPPPQVYVDALDEFLAMIEHQTPSLQMARDEIRNTQTVSFFPGLGELFRPGSKLVCFPEGMEGTPLGCSVVQNWYDEEVNTITNQVKRRFILVVEFLVSVGDELVFVAASDVYPEFHGDPSRNVSIKDLQHRKLWIKDDDDDDQDEFNKTTQHPQNKDDQILFDRLQQRGEFYASVATKNHFLEYHPHSFFPIISSGWSNHAVRPLTKGGRVMVDVKRGILEGHLATRGNDGMSDTVKEAIKLFEQSKRTGMAVPFRTCRLPGFDGLHFSSASTTFGGDRHLLWQAWPMLTGFSFTARAWGKLLLGMPKRANTTIPDSPNLADPSSSPKRAPMVKVGVAVGGLGGVGSCGNCGYINFQEKAFDQLVLDPEKKELIRAVARNAGGVVGPRFEDDDDDEDEYDDEEEIGIDVVANKGGASIFLLHGPPGCGKTLTAEAIAELLRKPLYVVTAGDLGITASEVEKTLGSVLELCQTWDALVLIDEADVFLEARNSHEIERNALVCVMLRLLEYYSGCLFLSSNRSAGSIDAAIASRITVMLGYPPLDADGRAQVWKNLIELVPTKPDKQMAQRRKESRHASRYRLPFTETDFQSLATGFQLNGRQIKNSIVLARALARERNVPLSLPILHRAVKAVAGEDSVIHPFE
jgi:hypothetical protein